MLKNLTKSSIPIFGDLSVFPDNPVDSARYLLDRGFKVVPFRVWQANGEVHKTPAINQWKDYRISKSDCLLLVEQCGAYGIVVPEKTLVVDLDVAKGTTAVESKYVGLDTLCKMSESVGADLEWMDTVTVNTPTGGMHLWYRLPSSISLTQATQIAPGVDIRVPNKGLVLMPSSIGANSQKYEFDLYSGISEVCLAPHWFLKFILLRQTEQKKELARVKDRFIFTLSPNIDHTQVKTYLTERTEYIRTAIQGSRNNTLNAVAYSIYKRVAQGLVPLEQAEHEIWEAAHSAGLDSKETYRTMLSARTAVL